MAEPVCIGLDVGTSGVRGCAVTDQKAVLAQANTTITADQRRSPAAILAATHSVLRGLAAKIGGDCRGIVVSGTSGSFVALDRDGTPIGPLSLYSDRPTPKAGNRAWELVSRRRESGVSPDVLARLIDRTADDQVATISFETDYVAASLAKRRLPTDFNSGLKAGADPVNGHWAGWLDEIGLRLEGFPELVEPGSPVTPMDSAMARDLGFRNAPMLFAGTTDGCASALAAGVTETGDAVTSLGSTLVLKVVSDRRITSQDHGVYSHRILGRWLVGGASNAGGAVLRQIFGDTELERLSRIPIASAPSKTRYVPLTHSGERFPVVDPYLIPRLIPRLPDDSEYFLALIDSLVRWERRGYTALETLIGKKVTKIAAVGGGVQNAAWMQTRARDLDYQHVTPLSTEPAFGAGLLALRNGAFN
ncbi:FGGY-family carbohydrate kinase [Aquicoccus porphyridii]|uniref:FGGY-family carbohydrate kinase n=1 Tax=Aquicoccus porphyridii TaxID=1852029 RepID=UPI00273EA67E|nr:FGGY-family carbohydrate kinase [Aquicoccus porphyridii]